METDEIKEVCITQEGRLQIKPSTKKFPNIYRETMEVHWDAELLCLYSPVPRDWGYIAWIKQIVKAAEEQGCRLNITDLTMWVNVPDNLKPELTDAIK